MSKDEKPGPGHNSGETVAGGIAAERMQSFVERIERLEEEQAALAVDKREIYIEVKSAGFDVKTMRQVIRRRKIDRADREEQDALLDLYERALGDLLS